MEDVLSRPFYEEVRKKLGEHHISYRRKDWKADGSLLAAASLSDAGCNTPGTKNWRNYMAAASVITAVLLLSFLGW